MAGGESHRVCGAENSWNTTLVSGILAEYPGILAQYPGYWGGIVGDVARLLHGCELVVERQRREESHEHSIDADEPQRLPRRHGATRSSVRHCSALRVLRALPGPHVVRSGEQQCAVNGGGESRQVPLGECPDLRENGAFSGTECADLRGRLRRSPGECPARSPREWGVLRPRWAAWARSPASSVRCVGGVHGGRRRRHRVCAGKDSSRRGGVRRVAGKDSSQAR